MADEEILMELKAIAEKEKKTTSQVIREALAAYVVARRSERREKNPLLALVGLGESEEIDVSERDEEILRAEVHPVQGWSISNGHNS